MQRRAIYINPVLAAVTPIEIIAESESIGSATGFLYWSCQRTFLVTNRHVVAPVDRTATDIKIRVHSGEHNAQTVTDLELALYEGGDRRWLEFPDPSIDVAAIELDIAAIRDLDLVTFSADNLPPDNLLVGLGEDVLVIGYPLGFCDDVWNLPVIRSATVASAYPVPFRGLPHFLVDARLHPGTSGSPVILKPTNILKTREKTSMTASPVSFLLGIHSHTWNVPNGQDPLGLHAVWYASLIEDLTK